MNLTDEVIKKEMATGRLKIGGFIEKNLGPNSYDMTLGPVCKVYSAAALGKGFSQEKITLDCKSENPVMEITIPESGFTLLPNHLYLYSCNEKLTLPDDICATVMGKSSLGRLGLDIHVCAGFVDSGFSGSIVLEMRTIYPLKIYPNMKICQVKFERTESPANRPYGHSELGSKYQGQEGVVASQYHKNF